MKYWYRIYFGLSAGILFLLGSLLLFSHQHTFSENENRVLAELPEFHWDDFWSGDYQSALEEGVNDQVAGRDFLTALASFCQRTLGYRDIGGVYLGQDDTLITRTDADDIDQFRYMENLRYVQYLSDRTSDQVSLMLVPSAGSILSEKLPPYAPFYADEAMYQAAKVVCTEVEVLDLREGLSSQRDLLEQDAKDVSVYFRTDHHWTLPGAYQGYAAYIQAQGKEPRGYASFAPEIVSEEFRGTLYSKVLDWNLEPDVMFAATKVGRISSVVCDGQEQDSIYDRKKLRTKDKYAYFFGGNYGEVTIRTKAESKRKLLIFKDSFANSMAPFFLEDYAELTMIDLRYYRRSVAELLEEQEDAEILVLYEMSNFAEDTNLFKLSK